MAEIAGQVKPEGVSLDQMLVALQRANPNAFVGNNINRLRSGQILNVPGPETARAVPSGEARRIVVAQSADFNNYRNRLASQVAGASSSQGEGGQIASALLGAAPSEGDRARAHGPGRARLSAHERQRVDSRARCRRERRSRARRASRGKDFDLGLRRPPNEDQPKSTVGYSG